MEFSSLSIDILKRHWLIFNFCWSTKIPLMRSCWLYCDSSELIQYFLNLNMIWRFSFEDFCKNCFKFRWKIMSLIFKRKERFWIEILNGFFLKVTVTWLWIWPQSKFQSVYKVTYIICTFSEWLLMNQNYVECRCDVVTVVWNKFWLIRIFENCDKNR